jgi:hypothetical protein
VGTTGEFAGGFGAQAKPSMFDVVIFKSTSDGDPEHTTSAEGDSTLAVESHPGDPVPTDRVCYCSASGSASFRKCVTSRKNCIRFFSIMIVWVPSLNSMNRLYGVWVSLAKYACDW